MVNNDEKYCNVCGDISSNPMCKDCKSIMKYHDKKIGEFKKAFDDAVKQQDEKTFLTIKTRKKMLSYGINSRDTYRLSEELMSRNNMLSLAIYKITLESEFAVAYYSPSYVAMALVENDKKTSYTVIIRYQDVHHVLQSDGQLLPLYELTGDADD